MYKALCNIHASGVSICDKPDIANARIEFTNGCRKSYRKQIFNEKHGKSRFFQQDSYIAVDFLKKNYEVIQLSDHTDNSPFVPTIDLGEKGVKQFNILKKDAPDENAIKEELKSFIESIKDNNNPVVDLYAAGKRCQLLLKSQQKSILITFNNLLSIIELATLIKCNNSSNFTLKLFSNAHIHLYTHFMCLLQVYDY